jgi:hypothetical protein
MMSDRRAATLIGVLYIIGTAAGVAGMTLMPSLDAGTDVLAAIAAHRTATIAGTLLVLVMGFALAALPAVFYPIGRRFSEVLSMGYVIFRGALEGIVYVISVFIWLVLIATSAGPVAAAAPVAAMLQTAQRLVWEQLIALPFVVGAFMFYWLLFRTRLVPRWVSVWGLVGGVLYLGAPLARMAGLNLDFLMFPLAIQEMVLAVWLIVKGFNPEALAQGSAHEAAPHPESTRASRGTTAPAGLGEALS